MDTKQENNAAVRQAPRFTFGLPVVKTKYFREAFESLINQSYGDYEIVVVDNVADADVPAILADYPQARERVRYYRNETRKPMCDNWNYTLSLARGEFFILFSDDDIAGKDYLLEASRIIEKHGEKVDVIVVRRDSKTETETLAITPSRGEWESAWEFIYQQVCFNGAGYTAISDLIFRRSRLIEEKCFFDLPSCWGTDNLAVYYVGKRNGVFFTPTVQFTYRMNAQNVSSTSSKLNLARGWRKFYLKLVELFPQIPVTERDEPWRKLLLKNAEGVFRKRVTGQLSGARNLLLFPLIPIWISRRDFGLRTKEVLLILAFSVRNSAAAFLRRLLR